MSVGPRHRHTDNRRRASKTPVMTFRTSACCLATSAPSKQPFAQSTEERLCADGSSCCKSAERDVHVEQLYPEGAKRVQGICGHLPIHSSQYGAEERGARSIDTAEVEVHVCIRADPKHVVLACISKEDGEAVDDQCQQDQSPYELTRGIYD